MRAYDRGDVVLGEGAGLVAPLALLGTEQLLEPQKVGRWPIGVSKKTINEMK
jgi:hypothetical protein